MAEDGLKKIRSLDDGSQAELSLWQRRSDKLQVVVKTYKKGNREWVENVPREAYILKTVLPLHPRIIRCLNWNVTTEAKLQLSLEYCKGGDLRKFVRPDGPALPEHFLWHVFIQTADALTILHHGYSQTQPDPRMKPKNWQPVVHATVCPSNIYCRQACNPDGRHPCLALADFSNAFLDESQNAGGGSLIFQPPEYPFVSAKTDVWGLGATIHALAHGRAPMVPMSAAERKAFLSSKGEEEADLAHAWLSKNKSRNVKQLPGQYSNELNYCMMRCLALEMDDRIDSYDLVAILVEDKANGRSCASHVTNEEVESLEWERVEREDEEPKKEKQKVQKQKRHSNKKGARVGGARTGGS